MTVLTVKHPSSVQVAVAAAGTLMKYESKADIDARLAAGQ